MRTTPLKFCQRGLGAAQKRFLGHRAACQRLRVSRVCLPRPEIKPSCAACDNSTPGAVSSGENGLQCPGKPSKIPCKSWSELSNPHSTVPAKARALRLVLVTDECSLQVRKGIVLVTG